MVTVFAAEKDDVAAEQQETVTALPVLAEMDYEIHLMTVEEAVMVFELSGATGDDVPQQGASGAQYAAPP